MADYVTPNNGDYLTYLSPIDRRFVAERLPRDLRDLMKVHGGKLFVGGGFLRSVIAGEEINDIDVFGSDKDFLLKVANGLSAQRPGSKIHTTKNAITLLTPNRMTIQFITRWTFDRPDELVKSFDFTVCQAAIWRSAGNNGDWHTRCSSRFYEDLAARRLWYTSPTRDEEAGGSMLRVIKYVKRGYSIQVSSLGAVIARLAVKIRESGMTGDEVGMADVLTGLLREVDPRLVVDGLDVSTDHETDDPADLPRIAPEKEAE